jgi:hypothetical protein
MGPEKLRSERFLSHRRELGGGVLVSLLPDYKCGPGESWEGKYLTITRPPPH